MLAEVWSDKVDTAGVIVIGIHYVRTHIFFSGICAATFYFTLSFIAFRWRMVCYNNTPAHLVRLRFHSYLQMRLAGFRDGLNLGLTVSAPLITLKRLL